MGVGLVVGVKLNNICPCSQFGNNLQAYHSGDEAQYYLFQEIAHSFKIAVFQKINVKRALFAIKRFEQLSYSSGATITKDVKPGEELKTIYIIKETCMMHL